MSYKQKSVRVSLGEFLLSLSKGKKLLMPPLGPLLFNLNKPSAVATTFQLKENRICHSKICHVGILFLIKLLKKQPVQEGHGTPLCP